MSMEVVYLVICQYDGEAVMGIYGSEKKAKKAVEQHSTSFYAPFVLNKNYGCRPGKYGEKG